MKSSLRLLLSFVWVVVIGGCAAEEAPPEEIRSEGFSLNTFGPDFIQIDELNGGPADANLFVGLDPADGSASANLPAGPAGAVFIDWEDVAAEALSDHFLYDLDNSSGRDESSFPRSNECVGSSSVLSKMDLTYAGAYNNTEHAYFVVQRSDNNGDAAYYWLFTKVEPTMALGQAPCRAAESRLLYTISEGDILFSGHFKPSASVPLLRVFEAKKSTGLLTAVEAINFTDTTLWGENADAIEAVAVNTTKTQPGTLGTQGVKAIVTGNSGPALGPEIIAEIAVDTNLFTGGQPCGATFFGSVISRSSGSGGTSPDLKDLVGPALFNFGEATAEGSITLACEPLIHFEGTGFGLDGSPLENAECLWIFDEGTPQEQTSDLCESPEAGLAMAVGAHTAKLQVTDPFTQCSATVDVGSFEIFEPLSVEASLDATCDESFLYNSVVTGGSPAGVSYAWSFSPGGVVPSSLDSAGGTATVDVATPPIEYTATVTVTDLRGDGLLCEASDSASGTPFAEIAVNITPSSLLERCDAMESDAVTYTAHASGGDGLYTFVWSDPSCVGNTCVVNPSDSDFCVGPLETFVTVDDGSVLCSPATSESEFYRKITEVTSTDNPPL